tara:strand:- start:517 stop:759 length:243 start_codon:yes stop_codon:yes gene_type:complete
MQRQLVNELLYYNKRALEDRDGDEIKKPKRESNITLELHKDESSVISFIRFTSKQKPLQSLSLPSKSEVFKECGKFEQVF